MKRESEKERRTVGWVERQTIIQSCMTGLSRKLYGVWVNVELILTPVHKKKTQTGLLSKLGCACTTTVTVMTVSILIKINVLLIFFVCGLGFFEIFGQKTLLKNY